MNTEHITSLFLKHKESSLKHRYITNKSIEPLLEKFTYDLEVNTIGKSVLGKSIYSVKIGNGNKRILLWSQMHGNESTTTKAIFDILNTLLNESSTGYILKSCTLCIIPILNPDGAESYTRVNANNIDLNRDAQNLSQPESVILRTVFNKFKPHFCYNLHGQRTIFGAGNTNKSATVSFLAPAQDIHCTITSNRKIAMDIISVMNAKLQELIPNQIGVYDDAFNLNCVGDTFQSNNVPTILFEAGHYHKDYAREKTREFIYTAMLESFDYLANNTVEGDLFKAYFDIPENKKCFFDIIIRNVIISEGDESRIGDIAIMYQEKLVNNKIEFIPKIEKIGNLNNYYGHKEIDACKSEVLDEFGNSIKVNGENVFVMINNKRISLI